MAKKKTKFIRKNGRVIPISASAKKSNRTKSTVGATGAAVSGGAYAASVMKKLKAMDQARVAKKSAFVAVHAPKGSAIRKALGAKSVDLAKSSIKNFKTGTKLGYLSLAGAATYFGALSMMKKPKKK